jgi:hypothetical protein
MKVTLVRIGLSIPEIHAEIDILVFIVELMADRDGPGMAGGRQTFFFF